MGTASSAMNAHILDETDERWIDLMVSDEEEYDDDNDGSFPSSEEA